jgi:hypothetical protein
MTDAEPDSLYMPRGVIKKRDLAASSRLDQRKLPNR